MSSELPFGPKATKRSVLSSLTEEPDPLSAVVYTGDLEVDAAAEAEALGSAFKARRKREDKRFSDATDSEYWFAVCFRSRADKDAFLAQLPNLPGNKYISGYDLARSIGIEVI